MRSWVSVAILLSVSIGASALSLEEPPAGEETWGYRPADGAESDRNPPAFTWFPSLGAVRYNLEVSPDRAFDEISYHIKSTPWSSHCPPKTFSPGTYYWRYAAIDKEGSRSNWSAVRSFHVSGLANPFPQPDLATLLSRMPADHPRLFMRPEEIPALREAAHARQKEAWAKVLATADKLLTDNPDMSEPPLYPKGTERLSQEWKKIWWGNRTRTIAVTQGAETLALAWRITEDEKYAAASKELLLAMCAWDPKGSTQYDYNDEAAMPILYHASRAYDWLHPYLSENERQQVIDIMAVRGKDCFDHLRKRQHLWKPYASHSNRAWHWLGEVAIAFHGDIPEADTWLDYAMTIFCTCYPVWGDSDGGWHEGMAYWSSYLSRFMNWAFIIKPAFGMDAFDRPFFHQAGNFALYVMPPGSQHGGFGDHAERMTPGKVASLMATFAAGAHDPYWQWYANETGGELSNFFFAYRAGAAETKAPTDLPTSKVFRGVGVAALNTNLADARDDIQVLFKSSPMGRISHGYNANNAFQVNVHGAPIFLNTGSRDVYGSPHHKHWMWETKSQNAILVNGEGQYEDRLASVGRITAFETSPTVDIVAGEAGSSYADLDRWARRIIFLKPGVIVIHDVLDAPEPSTFQWLLHAPGQFSLDENAAAYTAGENTVTAHFVAPANLSLTQNNTYDPPPHEWANLKIDEWHLTAANDAKDKHREFLTILTVNDTGASWTVNQTGEATSLTIRLAPNDSAVLTLAPRTYAVTRGNVALEYTD